MDRAATIAYPHKAVVGFLDKFTKKDAIEYARGYAQRHFDAPDITFVALIPFMDGWLYELQEGGPGLSYLPPVVKALTERAEIAWFRVGDRVFSVTMRDGKCYGVLLPRADSQQLMERGVGRMMPSGRMKRLINPGTDLFYAGLTSLILSLVFSVGSAAFYLGIESTVPLPRKIDPDQLPHRSWSQVDKTQPNTYVDSLFYKNSRWQAQLKTIPSINRSAPTQSGTGPSAPVPSQALPPRMPVPAPQSSPAVTAPGATPAAPSGAPGSSPAPTTPLVSPVKPLIAPPAGTQPASPVAPPVVAPAVPQKQTQNVPSVTAPVTAVAPTPAPAAVAAPIPSPVKPPARVIPGVTPVPAPATGASVPTSPNPAAMPTNTAQTGAKTQ